MKSFFLILVCFLLSSTSVFAQDISPYPLCAELVNETEYEVRGTVNTASATYEDPDDPIKDGTWARHSVNFRIEPDERYEICSTGPFFEGQRVELVLKTFVPVFDCYTQLIAPISIQAERRPDGEYRTWAECF